jgi:hypothetical protein
MNKLSLPNVTLAIIDCINKDEATTALNICLYYADFGDVKFFTDMNVDTSYKISIPHIGGYSDYSRFVFNKLDDFITTDYVLVVQHDGFILNPDAWTDDFFKYDYIGALLGPDELPEIVGNGGFSLRSKKLLTLCKELGKLYTDTKIEYSEDLVICYFFRDWLEQKGIKFGTIEDANKFSTERTREWKGSFGFHNFWFCNPYKYGWVCPIDYKHDLTNYMLNIDHSKK